MELMLVSPADGGPVNRDPAAARTQPLRFRAVNTGTGIGTVRLVASINGVAELVYSNDPDVNTTFQSGYGGSSVISDGASGYYFTIVRTAGWPGGNLAVTMEEVIVGGNIAPIAQFTKTLVVNRTYSVNSTSYDPDGTIVTYDWDWGDGTAHGSTSTPGNHTYATDGSKTITLTVTDNLGATHFYQQTFTVAGWDVDATSNKGVPSSTTQWTNVFTQLGFGTAPQDIYPLQDAGPTAVDVGSGAKNLSYLTSGSGAWVQTVPGGTWTRKAFKTTDGTNTGVENTTFGNINAGSMLALVYAYAARANGTGGATRSIARIGTAFDGDVTIEEKPSTLLLQLGNGNGSGRLVGAAAYEDVVRPYTVRKNFTGKHAAAFTDAERIGGGKSNAAGTGFRIGGDNNQTYFADDAYYVYAAVFTGSAAELTEVQIKALYAILGWSPAWTPRQHITKTAGSGAAYDSSAATGFVFASTVSVEFKITSLDAAQSQYCIGLSADNPDNNFNTIDFGLIPDYGGNMYRVENAGLVSIGACAVGDRWKVTRTIGTGAVTYLRDTGSGFALVNTSSNTTVAALCVDSSLYNSDSVIADVLITDAGGTQIIPTWTTSNALVS